MFSEKKSHGKKKCERKNDEHKNANDVRCPFFSDEIE